MNINIDRLVRENILKLSPYSSARSEFKGKASVWLDANENAFGSPLPITVNRYPDPLQLQLKEKLGKLKGILPENICLGNGSDELVDLSIRIFCEPKIDNVIVCPPTFRMYEVASDVNEIEVRKVMLDHAFGLDVLEIKKAIDKHTKIIFICSPNNPTGNIMQREAIEEILGFFKGIVIVDEAYNDFADQPSVKDLLLKNNNLMVMQTMSKVWGLAGLRLGMVFADKEIIRLLTTVKMPYNVSTPTQQLAMKALDEEDKIEEWKQTILTQRPIVAKRLADYSFVKEVYPSDANFLLVAVDNPKTLYYFLATRGVIVRSQTSQPGLEKCLRITIGTPKDNAELFKNLDLFES